MLLFKILEQFMLQGTSKANHEVSTFLLLVVNRSRLERAQITLATIARGRAARRQASHRRAHREVEHRACPEDHSTTSHGEGAQNSPSTVGVGIERELPDCGRAQIAVISETGSNIFAHDNKSRWTAQESSTARGRERNALVSPSSRSSSHGGVHFERVVTIDGTEVSVMADIQEVGKNCEGSRDDHPPLEMSLVATDRKANRSAKLKLDTIEIANVLALGTKDESLPVAFELHDPEQGNRDSCTSDTIAGYAQATFEAVLMSLTLFNSRQKDVFILSYKGRRLVAPH